MFKITKDLVSLASQALLTKFTCTQKLVFLSALIFIQSLHQSIQEQFSQTETKPCLNLRTPSTNKRLGWLDRFGKDSPQIPVSIHTVFKGILNPLVSFHSHQTQHSESFLSYNIMYSMISSNKVWGGFTALQGAAQSPSSTTVNC